MATIAEKLEYTSEAVDDIQAAINEKGVEVKNNIKLGLYGDKIREIKVLDGDISASIILKDLVDVTDEYNYKKDCYDIEKFIAFSEKDIEAKDIENVSNLYT